MNPIQQDLSIFDKFNFERKPVGVKFLLMKPAGIKKLDKKLAFCEMLPEAQEGSTFYATKEDFECVGPILLGMVGHDPIFESGQIGPRLEIFKEARANSRLYPYIPRVTSNIVNYVAFAPLDKLTFEPDVLVLATNPAQAEIILRASSYTTGKMWCGKATPVMGCAWILIYPYLSGEINFIITGLIHGIKARQVFPDGIILISIPWDLIPMMVENLKEMEWEPAAFTEGRDAHNQRLKDEVEALMKELQAK